jgi:hypothetical protein
MSHLKLESALQARVNPSPIRCPSQGGEQLQCGEIKPGSVQTLLRNIRMATADPAFWAELRGA